MHLQLLLYQILEPDGHVPVVHKTLPALGQNGIWLTATWAGYLIEGVEDAVALDAIDIVVLKSPATPLAFVREDENFYSDCALY